ncbi:hypothetical protein CDD81_3806 [Ophiocordyceps australis]|uniref:Uncharacterized protein n=1 Tax=Ophiocordyceps australis TaxID=1399860 RepID=A0A2C5XPA1_9HYPO|nr:hypothetical protein CDD81_3806 [Ophiocordyceps australis]
MEDHEVSRRVSAPSAQPQAQTSQIPRLSSKVSSVLRPIQQVCEGKTEKSVPNKPKGANAERMISGEEIVAKPALRAGGTENEAPTRRSPDANETSTAASGRGHRLGRRGRGSGLRGRRGRGGAPRTTETSEGKQS